MEEQRCPADVPERIPAAGGQPIDHHGTALADQEDRSQQAHLGQHNFQSDQFCQALGITKLENGVDLTKKGGGLWIEEGLKVPNSLVTKGPRVGLNNTPEPWLSKPWRFKVKDWKIL